MASNVIIEDDKGNPVTYQNVRSVTLDGEDGGTVLFINEEDVLQPDMEQTDATALDFVKNQYFGVLPDNLTAKELTFTPSKDTDKLYEAKKLPFGVPLVIGQTYIVTWGDTECELVAKDAADIKNPWNTTLGSEPYLGNSYIIGLVFGSEEWGENTGEPFLIVGGECVTTDLTATTRVVGVRLANNTKKLDSQWLPDGVATEAFVDEKIAAIDMPECNQAQADMAQTDPKAPDFVKNQYFGVLPVNLTEKEFSFRPNPADEFGYSAIDFNLEAPIVIGQTYVVTWDDVEFVLVAKDAADIETSLGVSPMSAPYLGNSSFVGYAWGATDWGEDTGEPFLINHGSAGSSDNCLTSDTSVTTHTVGIRPANREKKLDAKWLPDGLATEAFVEEKIAAIEIPEGGGGSGDGAGLPEVTFADNGKVLGVVEGVWAKMDAPSGGGSSVSTETVILAEQTLTGFAQPGESVPFYGFSQEGRLFSIVLNETYIVNWDGTEYTVIGKEVTQDGVTLVCIGNESIATSANDTGEPFLMYYVADADMSCIATSDTTTNTHTVAIYQKTPLSVSWNSVTDKPFGGESIHIVVDHSKVDTSIMFSIPELDMTLVKLSSETLSKDDLIGATFEATFPGGTTESAVVSEADLQIEYNKGFCYLVVGMVPVWVCLEAGEHTISKDGQSSTFNVPEVGCYVADFAVEQLESSQITKNSIKYLDNKYLDFMENKAGTEVFLSETTFTSVEDGDGSNIYEAGIYTDPATVKAWTANRDPLIVVYDGTEYKVTAQVFADHSTSYVYVGDMSDNGGIGNNEPFRIIALTISGYSGFHISLLKDTAPTEHTVAIFKVSRDSYMIKPESLPILQTELSRQEFVPKTTSTTGYYTDFGAFGFEVPLDEDMYNTWSANTKPVIVRYDGVEYVLEPQLIDPFGTGMPGVGVGNLAAFGGVSNGEPFAIAAIFDLEADGSKSYAFLCGSMVDTSPTDHTIAVYLQTEVQKVKEEYIPSNLSVRWNNITDKPFSGDKTHIVITNDDIDVDTAVEIPELGTTFIRLTDKTLSKDELIGCSMSMRFITGELVTATISQPDISFADDNILIGTVLGGIPFVIVYKAGAVQIPIDVIAPGTPGYLTIDIPATGFYSIDELAELADKLELVSDTIKHLDNRYISFVDVEEATSTDFLPELMIPELSEIATKFTTDPASGEYLLRIPTDIDITLKIAPAWNSKWDYARVNWDGVEYNCVPQTIGAYKLIGNMSYLSGGSGAEPFVAVIRDNNFEIYDTVNATTPILSNYLEFNTIENTSYYKATTRISKGLVEGSAYVVQANNTKYVDRQSAKSYISGDTTYIGIGNPGLIGLSSTDEFDSGKDFFIYSIEMSDGTYEWSVILTKEPTSSSVYVSPYCDVTNTFSIDLVCAEKPIIKPESIGEVSWDKISNKPFDDAKEVVIVDEEVVFKYDGSPTNTETEYYATIASVDENSIIPGEEYLVNINGVECVGRHTTIDGLNVIECESNDGLVKCGVIFAYPGLGNVVTINVSNSVEFVTDTPVKFTIKINNPIIKKLDEKYLPILDKVGEVNDIMQETTGTTVYISDFNVFALIAQTTEDMFNYWHGNTTPALTGNVGIEFDGNTYECAPQRIAAFDAGLCFGDLTLLGGTGNGEPFIVTCWPEAPGVYYFFVVALADTAETEHTARIYRDDRQYKIKEEYIPALPEFDLGEMGLPALIIGGSVETECDTTAIRNALDQGFVKLKFIASVVEDTPVSGVVNAMCMGGGYNCGFVGALAGIPMMLNFEVLPTKITGSIITLSSASN